MSRARISRVSIFGRSYVFFVEQALGASPLTSIRPFAWGFVPIWKKRIIFPCRH